MVEVQPPQHTTNNCNNNNGDDVYNKHSSSSSALPINNTKPRTVLPGVDHSYKNFSGYNRPHHNHHSRAAQNNNSRLDYNNTHQIRQQNHSSKSNGVGNGVQRIKKFTLPPPSSNAQHNTQNNSHMSQSSHTSHNNIIKDRTYPLQQERATAYNRTAAERSSSDGVGRRTVSSDFHREHPRSNYDHQPTSYTSGPNERINSTTTYERGSRNSISGAGGSYSSSSSRVTGESSSRIRSEVEDRDSRLFNIGPGGEKRSSFEGGRRAEELSNNRDMTRTVSAGSYSQLARDSGGRAVNTSREFSSRDGGDFSRAASSSFASLGGEDLRVRDSGRDYSYAQGGYREERRVQHIDGVERSTSSYSSMGGGSSYSTAVDNSKKRARDYSFTVEREGARDVGSSYPPSERRSVLSDDYSRRNRWGEEKSTTAAAPQSSSYQQPKSYVGNKFRDAPPKSNDYMYEERYESSSRTSGVASRGDYSRIAERSGGVARGEYSKIADRASQSPQRSGRDEYSESRRSLPTYRGEYQHHSSSSYRQSEMDRGWEDKGKSYTSSEVQYSSRKESPISRRPPQQREQWDNPNSPGRPQYQQQQQQRDHPSSPNSRQHQQQQPREEFSTISHTKQNLTHQNNFTSQAVQHQESKR